MEVPTADHLKAKIADLEQRLADAEHLIDAIRTGEVDAFAIQRNDAHEVYTLQSGDYAYRVLVERFGEGALNLTEDGLIVYTNNSFCKMVNKPYELVVGTSVYDYILPDFTEKFTSLLTHALTGQSKGEITIGYNGGGKPVYISLTSLQPNLPTIGMIITDLTEKKANEKIITGYQGELELKNKLLAAKNAELQDQNEELASFSYIASHDLQEPLRKIQAFSSRILEKESEQLSDSGKDYFMRISDAASRMQKLIEALLNYSRTNTTEIILEPTDLNIVLSDVLRDLQELIAEKNVTIESDPLPVANVVPLQFQQLFANIISNAIKYSKPELPPHITLTMDVVSGYEVAQDIPPASRYWKISISDNGIGFEPQHQARVFELFQRLHGKKEYEGTGIGLAICKKIMHNHKGYITAEGRPGEGATFNIYLPYPNESG